MKDIVLDHTMLGEHMKRISLLVVFLLSVVAVSAGNYDRGVSRTMSSGYNGNYNPYNDHDQNFPYAPYGTSIAEDVTLQGYYDPVIFGPLGNAYYAGQFAYTYFPFTPGQAVNYYASGPYYRYEAPYRSYGGYGSGYGSYNPAYRIYGVGY